MKHKKKNNPKRPIDVRKQIIDRLKTEQDPYEREKLQQRLHHYNIVCKK